MKLFLKKIDTAESVNGRKLHIYTYRFRGRSLDKEPIPQISGEHKGYKWVNQLSDELTYSGNTANFFKKYNFRVVND